MSQSDARIIHDETTYTSSGLRDEHGRTMHRRIQEIPMMKSKLFLAAACVCLASAHAALQEGGSAPARRPPVSPEISAATATGDAAAVLGLEQKIEAAVVKGDVAFAETVLSSDFHFRHGDGWTRGEPTGG